jgi:hypothetical protein
MLYAVTAGNFKKHVKSVFCAFTILNSLSIAARPQRPALAISSQPRQKVSPVIVSAQQTVQLQPTASHAASMFAATGVCNVVNRNSSTVALTMDHLNGRLNQLSDRFELDL